MKIAVFAINPNFFGTIREELRAYHHVREYDHTNKEIFNLVQINRLLDWCDIAFFDFAQFPLNAITKFAALEKPLVVRGHSLELYEAASVTWEKVSLLIISPEARNILLEQPVKTFPKIIEMPVGIDPDFYTLSPKRSKKKFGKEIVTVQNFMGGRGKRVYTTIQTFSELYDQDPEWKLWVIAWDAPKNSPAQRRELRAMKKLRSILGLEDAIIGVKKMPKPAWKNFLMDKDIFWSNSTSEVFHASLAEHMATGGYPVINCWSGSGTLYPPEWVHRTQSSMVKAMLEWSSFPLTKKLRLAKKAREWILQYDEKKVAVTIREALENVYKK